MESLLLCGDTSHSYISASNKKKLNNNINNNNNNPSSKEGKKTKKFVKKCVSYYDPNLVVKSDIEVLRFEIHYFELLQYKHGESFLTPPIQAFDHYWRLQFWPNGSNTGPQGYIACGLCLCENPTNTNNPNPTTSSSNNVNNNQFDNYFDVIPNAGSFGSIGSTGSTISNNGNNQRKQNQNQQKFQNNNNNKQPQPSSPPKAVWTFQINNHNHNNSFISKEFTRVFNKFNQPYGENKLISVSNAINNYMDCEGSLIIDVHLQVYIQKQRTWYPSKIQQQQQDDDDDDDYDPSSSSSSSPPPPPGKQYLKSKVGSDITFVVGQEEERIYAHKCILFHRSPGLYEQLFEAAADSEGADNKNNDHQEQQQQQQDNNINNNNNNKQNNQNNEIFLRDINVSTFKILLDYIYTGKLPNLLLTTTETESDDDGGCCSDPTTTDTTTDSEIGTVTAGNNNNAPRQQQQQQQQAKELLKVANRFNCSDLKLYIESVITDKLVTIDTAADWLLLADSYVCPLLKEECMKLYIENPIGVMSQSSSEESSSTTTTTESAWDKVLESNTLLQELLHFATIESKKIGCSSIQKNSSYDYDYQNMSVRSLREKLESFNLNLDGTKNMLIQRLQNYHNDIEDLMLFSTKTTTTCNNTTQQQQQKPSTASADGDEPDAAMS